MNRNHARFARVTSVAGAVAAALMSAPAPAQQQPSVIVDVGNCVNLPTPAERSACYEASVEAAQRQGAAAPPAPPPAPAAAAAPSAIGEAPPLDRPKVPDPPPVVITASVTEAHETVPNHLTITLDNGQVWRQVRAKFFPLRPGTPVTLVSTEWGTDYRLTGDGLKGFIQVERVR
jgi:uncharacterized protein with LGFP repeats